MASHWIDHMLLSMQCYCFLFFFLSFFCKISEIIRLLIHGIENSDLHFVIRLNNNSE